MNDGMFLTWLQEVKGMKERSARDVLSRLKRAKAIINDAEVTHETLGILGTTDMFLELSVNVKSQLRRSVMLYLEYSNK